MPWQAWVLLAWLGTTAAMQFYYIDRPRLPKTHFEGILGAVECGLAAWLVVVLAS